MKFIFTNLNSYVMRKFTLFFAFILFIGMQYVQAQDREISGTVISADDNKPIPGVQVVVEGTTIGTVTNLDGFYELAVPASAKRLVYSFVGMVSQTIEIGTQTSINITLATDMLNIEGVVVTALGIKRETKALGYSVTEVGNEELTRTQNTNMVNGLAGKVAGVQVASASGAAGGSSFITIRGVASILGNNQPLFVVDGIPITNDQRSSGNPDDGDNNLLEGVAYSNRAIDLNPEDIESISVLKGGAATALYGLRAANGAIIITSKKGSSVKGQKIAANFHASVSFDQVNKLPEMQTKYAQGIDGLYKGPETGRSTSWGPEISSLSYVNDPNYKWDSWGYLIDTDDVPAGATTRSAESYNNVEDFWRTGVTSNISLNLTGGSDKASFFFSVGDQNTNSHIPNNKYRKTSFKLAGSSNLSEKIKASANVNYIASGGDRIQQGSNTSGVMLGLLRTPPSFDNANHYEDPADEPLAYSFPDGSQRNYRGGGGYDNPYWTVNKNSVTDDVDRVIASVSLEYLPLDWLTIAYRVGNDFYSDKRELYFSVGSRNLPNGQVSDDHHYANDFNSDLFINARRDLTEDIKLNLTVGHNMYQHYYKQQYQQGDGLTIPDFYHISNANSILARTVYEKKRTAAFYGDLGLSWKSMLFVNITGRQEWSTTLPSGSNSFFYPSFSGGFVFTELPGLKDNKILPFGKLRASYAIVANDATMYATETYYQGGVMNDGWVTGIAFPYQGTPGFEFDGDIGSIDLKPEKLKSFEIGLDLRFLQNRLFADIAYYNMKHEDLLLYVPVAASSGFRRQFMNAAKMENKGFEILLGGTPIKGDKFSWDISANFTKNNNKVIELAPGVDNVFLGGFDDPQIRAVAGYSYGYIYSTRFLEDENGNLIIMDDPNAANYGYPQSDPEVGAIKPTLPDWTMGITNDLAYGPIRLSFLFDIRQGGYLWNGTRGALDFFGTSAETEDRDGSKVFDGVYGHLNDAGEIVHWENGVEVAGPGGASSTNVPLGQAWHFDGEGSSFSGPASPYVEETSWIRLRELSLSYTLKKEWLKDSFVKSLDIYFAGRNLLLWTDYSGVDPETNLQGSINAQGFDYFNMPNTRTYTIGLKASF